MSKELDNIISYYQLEDFLDKKVKQTYHRVYRIYGLDATDEQIMQVYNEEEDIDMLGDLMTYYRTSYREANIIFNYFKDKLIEYYRKDR